jgi:hypothetical protein
MTIASWSEATGWLRSHHPVLDERADWMCVGWPARQPRQTLQAQRLRRGGRERVVLGADVTLAANLRAFDVLALNARLVDGTLVVLDGLLILRRVVGLDGLDAARLERTITWLASDAIRVRAALAPRPSTEMFNSFAE